MSVSPRVRVVVQLPYNRPDEPHPNPSHIEWNAEKANILWEVISLSRSSNNGGTDWKGLAAHLEVPLPYLLYRAQARYEEDLRGLQDIQGVLSTPTSAATALPTVPSTPAIPTPHSADMTPTIPSAHPLSIKIPSSRLAGVASPNTRRLSASQRLSTPLGVRARLNSLTHKSPSKYRGGQGTPIQGKTTSSSIATLRGTKRFVSVAPRTASPFSDEDESESSDEEELAQRKEEEIERQAEEQENLDKKLAQLQRMMTSERLGLVRSPMSQDQGKGRENPGHEEIIRGRLPVPISACAVSTLPNGNPKFNEYTGLDMRLAEFTSAARNRDHSASVSSASSPQGSIPSIPSPPIPSPSPPLGPASSARNHARVSGQPQPQTQAPSHLHPNSQPQSLAGSPLQRHLSPTKSSSPPAVSVRNARGHGHTRQGVGALGTAGVSEGESNHGSSASSFSDLSDASLSASALESALMSNMRGTGSKFSVAKSRFGARGVRQ